MTEDQLMEMATDRFNKKNRLCIEDYKKEIKSFLMYIYLNCDPATYGNEWAKYLIRKIKKSGLDNLYAMKDSCDVGDMGLIYPDFEYFSNKPAFTHPVNKTWHTLKYEDVFKVYSELKISYLGIKGSYTLRNLRKYQNLDYYIFTLVDCSDRFNYKIVALSHKDLYDRSGLTFSYMNGTKKQNETNTNVGVGSSFKKGSYLEENILSLNRMGGYSFDDLIEFIGKEDEKLKNDFIKRWDDKPLSNKW